MLSFSFAASLLSHKICSCARCFQSAMFTVPKKRQVSVRRNWRENWENTERMKRKSIKRNALYSWHRKRSKVLQSGIRSFGKPGSAASVSRTPSDHFGSFRQTLRAQSAMFPAVVLQFYVLCYIIRLCICIYFTHRSLIMASNVNKSAKDNTEAKRKHVTRQWLNTASAGDIVSNSKTPRSYPPNPDTWIGL
jgi:hypothetical protein